MNSDTDRPGTRHGGRIVATLAATLVAFAAVTASTGAARERTVDPRVAAAVTAEGQGSVPVIITLNADVDRRRFRGRPDALVRALRDVARRSQDGVVASLDGPSRRFWLVNALATRVDARELERLAADPRVERVELDERVTITSVTGDPQPPSEVWGVDAIQAPTAWASGLTGAGVRIGSIDTGVDPANAELAGAVVGWRDFVGASPTPYDDNGHGTHTIGTMVARNVGGPRIGVAPGATVVVAKAIGADGTASGSSLLAAAQWMTDPDGDPATADFPTVINNSWSASGWDNEWFRPMVQTWVALGIVPVFGAGNTAGSIGNPASYPESLTVGSVSASGGIAPNSSSGTLTWTVNGSPTTVVKPDVTAPGVMIASTLGTGYGYYSGTSMAAPHVAGAVALIRQARPDLTVDGVRALLSAGARDAGTPGPDSVYGAGIVDVARTLGAAGVPTATVAPPATTPAGAATTRPKIRVLRVTRRGSVLRITGRVSAQVRLRLAIRRMQKQLNARSATLMSVRTRAGRFTMTVRVPKLARGRYRLVVSAVGSAGTPIARSGRYLIVRR